MKRIPLKNYDFGKLAEIIGKQPNCIFYKIDQYPDYEQVPVEGGEEGQTETVERCRIYATLGEYDAQTGQETPYNGGHAKSILFSLAEMRFLVGTDVVRRNAQRDKIKDCFANDLQRDD